MSRRRNACRNAIKVSNCVWYKTSLVFQGRFLVDAHVKLLIRRFGIRIQRCYLEDTIAVLEQCKDNPVTLETIESQDGIVKCSLRVFPILLQVGESRIECYQVDLPFMIDALLRAKAELEPKLQAQ